MSRESPLPCLVLLPGLDGTGKLLADFVAAVAPFAQVRLVEYPRDAPLGYAELEKLAHAALPQERAYVLLAESFSGPLAMRIAADGPKGLAGVILCSTFAKNPYPWLRWAHPLVEWLPVKALPRWLRAPLLWGSARPARAPASAHRASAAVASPVLQHRIAALLNVDESHALARIALPILVLHGRLDRLVPLAAAQWVVNVAPHAQLITIEGPHLLLQTRPQECAAHVARFLGIVDVSHEALIAHSERGAASSGGT
jgi:pimeloyl-[acyl-carrier protein] methyl ester esterase